MADVKKSEEHQTLYYKTSTDWNPEKKTGIKAVIVTTEAQLVEAGVDEKAAKIIMQNVNSEEGLEASKRMVVIKDTEGKAQRVFSGKYFEPSSYEVKDKDGKEELHLVSSVFALSNTIDLKAPQETIPMDKAIRMEIVPYGGREFKQSNVDQIEQAIVDKKISSAQKVDPNVQLAGASDFNSLERPNVPKINVGLAVKNNSGGQAV